MAADISYPLFAAPAKAAQLLGISRSFLYERIGAGDITARRLGTRCCVDMSQAIEFMNSLPVPDIRMGKRKAA